MLERLRLLGVGEDARRLSGPRDAPGVAMAGPSSDALLRLHEQQSRPAPVNIDAAFLMDDGRLVCFKEHHQSSCVQSAGRHASFVLVGRLLRPALLGAERWTPLGSIGPQLVCLSKGQSTQLALIG